jgi:hypothetical protein
MQPGDRAGHRKRASAIAPAGSGARRQRRPDIVDRGKTTDAMTDEMRSASDGGSRLRAFQQTVARDVGEMSDTPASSALCISSAVTCDVRPAFTATCRRRVEPHATRPGMLRRPFTSSGRAPPSADNHARSLGRHASMVSGSVPPPSCTGMVTALHRLDGLRHRLPAKAPSRSTTQILAKPSCEGRPAPPGEIERSRRPCRLFKRTHWPFQVDGGGWITASISKKFKNEPVRKR